MRASLAPLALLLCLTALAPVGLCDLVVKGKTVLVVTELPFRVVGPEGADLYFWDVPAGWEAARNKNELLVTKAPDGPATVTLQTLRTDWDAKKNVTSAERVELIVRTGKAPDPGPKPGPAPPTPGKAAIDLPGLAVLVVEESKARSALPLPQRSIITSTEVRAYLDAKCVADPARAATGGKAWNIWDQHLDAKAMGKAWVDALARPRASLPWLIVSTPAGSYEGPLPADVPATMALLKQYGG